MTGGSEGSLLLERPGSRRGELAGLGKLPAGVRCGLFGELTGLRELSAGVRRELPGLRELATAVRIELPGRLLELR
ncbi:hypothetical protein [Nocardia cyriacigeorgica]|uniref:hypothetical protein n=1 Tax=Nocardia cyriacigeorgica TaxID=135487 RepID=UPI001107DBAD|nr:hypothetical protein [Nocardia cyriacigeorgica]MBF6324582.1 hypothetical protein [Nocardia cyriacigeorgica]TLF52476.1 hypothetical protein FEK31_27760 [Nocardia cyriacigeorgica]